MLCSFSSLQNARPLLPGRLTSSTTSAGRQKRASSAPSSAEPASSIAYSSAASVVRSRSLRPGSSSTTRIRCRPVGQMPVAGRFTARTGSMIAGSSSCGRFSGDMRPKSTPMASEIRKPGPSATRTQKIQSVMCPPRLLPAGCGPQELTNAGLPCSESSGMPGSRLWNPSFEGRLRNELRSWQDCST